MRRAAGSLVAGVLLLALIGPAMGGIRAEEDLRCGNLSPLGNVCSDGPRELEHERVAGGYVDTTNYVGHITVWLNHTVPGLGSVKWECDGVGPPPPQDPVEIPSLLTFCTGPFFEGNLVEGQEVQLFCKARATLYAGLAPVGPVGMWRCAVDL